MVTQIDIDESLIDNTITSLLDIIQTLILQTGTKLLGNFKNLIDNRFGNSIGILIITATIGITAYLTIRRASSA